MPHGVEFCLLSADSNFAAGCGTPENNPAGVVALSNYPTIFAGCPDERRREFACLFEPEEAPGTHGQKSAYTRGTRDGGARRRHREGTKAKSPHVGDERGVDDADRNGGHHP